MKEEYKRFFDNGTQMEHEFCYAVIIFMVTIPICVAIDSKLATVLICILLGLIIKACEFLKSKASFNADDTQVTFLYFGRNTIISYNDIKELKLERRYNKRKTRLGIKKCYVETLTITTAERVYSYSAEMDFDYNLKKSEFSRLKTYIEEQMKL